MAIPWGNSALKQADDAALPLSQEPSFMSGKKHGYGVGTSRDIGKPYPAEEKKTAGDEMVEDAHPIKPFHDVLRSEGFKPHHSERQGDVRVNHYTKPNPGGGEETVELHHNQGRGPEFGSTNSVTKSGDPEGTAPRVNNSPEKLHRNIHAQSYRAPEGGVAPKMKPGEVREYAKKIKE